MKENPDFFKKVLEKTLAGGGNCADLFYEKREDYRFALSSTSDLVVSYGRTEGAALRLVKNGSYGNMHLESPDEKDLMLAAEMLREAASLKGDDVSIDHHFRNGSERKKAVGTSEDPGSEFGRSLETASAIKKLIQEVHFLLKEIFRESFSSSLSASFYRQKVEMMNFQEEFVSDTREAALFKASVSMKSAGETISFELSLGFPSAEIMVSDLRLEDLKGELVRTYMKKKNAVAVPEGKMPLILSPGAGGGFFHETAGHIFEADSPLLSKFYKELQSFDFGENLSIYDDPSLMERGSYVFDDEGIRGRRKALIERGRLMNLLHSVSTALEKDNIPLGNGRRQSFRNVPLPRTSALFVDSAESDPGSIVRSTQKGIYASKLGDAFFDESSGDFYIHITEGNIVEGGNISSPIKGALIKGNVFEFFKLIDQIGNDLSFDRTGLVCSKAGQSLPATVGAPTMKIASVLVFPA